MSRFLMTAAEVVGAVAIVVASAGTLAPAATAGVLSSLGITATATTVATIAGLASAGLGLTAQLLAKKPSQIGSPEEWKADPDAPIDLVFGDAFNAGHIIYRQAYGVAAGKKNSRESLITEWSLGPVHSIDTLYVDNVAKSVVGQVVDIDDRGKMYEARQLGLCAEPGVLIAGGITPHGWTETCKLSGLAATITTFLYDSKGGHTFTSIPACGWRGKGLLCWDPRKDATYPGGAGPQRRDDQTTWVWSDNPFVVGLTYCLGWRQNGKLAGGVGTDLEGVLIDQFVEGMNVADANEWRIGGVKSSTDDKWDTLKDILQAGGGEPVRLGAMLGCIVRTPRVSLATIDRNALADGEIVVPAMTARRDRINAVSPSYMNEQRVVTDDANGNPITTTTWAMVSGEPIIVDDYVTADGRQRRKPQSYPLVQCFFGEEPTQVAQLARYDIEDAREFGPISLPLKLRWMAYKPGDVVTVDLPEAGLNNQNVLLLTRSLEPSSGVVTVTARSETAAKHAFALGQTTTAPPSPSVFVPTFGAPAPTGGDWTLDGTTISSASGSTPALSLALADGREIDDSVDAVIFEVRAHVDGQADGDGWVGPELSPPTVTTKVINSVAGGLQYDAAISYRSGGMISDRLILGPATPGVLSAGSSLQQAVFASFIVEAQNGNDVVHISSDGTLTIDDHTRRYPDGHADVAVTGATISTGLAAGTVRSIAYDDPGRLGGAVTYELYATDTDAWATAANPGRHHVGFFEVPSSGSSGGGGGGVGGGAGRRVNSA